MKLQNTFILSWCSELFLPPVITALLHKKEEGVNICSLAVSFEVLDTNFTIITKNFKCLTVSRKIKKNVDVVVFFSK